MAPSIEEARRVSYPRHEHRLETPRGYPNGIEQKILSGALDEANKRGTRTRLLRFAPGVFTTKPFVHSIGRKSSWYRAT